MLSSWGWEVMVDDHGVKYYSNPQLKVTQYQHPSTGIVSAMPQFSKSGAHAEHSAVPPKGTALDLPNGWEMLKDTDGYTYGSLFLL
jgi:hypothetical protein